MTAAPDPLFAPTVLIVDDIPANLEVIATYLEDQGFNVVIATNGTDGVKRAQRVRPDLILLDVMMPGISGFETCRQLKALPEVAQIPVIFMTALSDTEDKLAGFNVGGVDYVTKPIQVAEVMARIQTHLALRRATLELAERNLALQASQQQLVRTAKLAGLGALVSGIAHELNTPIGNALLAASTLRHEVESLRQQMAQGGLRRSNFEHFVQLMEQGTDMLAGNLHRAGDLVQRFKQIAILQKNDQRTTFGLDELVRSATKAFQLQMGSVPFQISVEVDPAIVMDTYFLTLEHVLLHLYSNVLRHAFEQNRPGRVSITAERLADDWVRVVFGDNGRGIAPERIGRIFDPFYTTQLGQGGSGIGLYAVYNQVTQLLGGRIDVESTPSQGTRFIIELPRVVPVD